MNRAGGTAPVADLRVAPVLVELGATSGLFLLEHEYEPSLKSWMDSAQPTAGRA
jgi:hypothetical protein